MTIESVRLAEVTLDDKYTLMSGRIYLSGIQALVRLPLVQAARDRAAGLNTAGFISGYRGSPLGTYDSALMKAQRHLDENGIRFQPGLNEDLAATSVWGSQQVNLSPRARVDGVFGIWYGKGPGVDRSADALKHANAAGTSRHGGVLALAGDDHGCQSSTLAHQSEHILQAAMIPILNPATIQDYLDFGIMGFAMSRFTGCWVGFKAISETAESSASVEADPNRVSIVIPDFNLPEDGLHIRWPDPPLEAEKRLHGPKMQAVAAFARANPFDRIVIEPDQPRLGIIATGKAYLDVRQALQELGIGDAAAAAMGIRLYKVGLTWPLEVEGARQFAAGLQDILVVEEKRGFIENQLAHILYNTTADRRPTLVGKQNEAGAPLLGSEGELSPTIVARAIHARLERLGETSSNREQRLARLESYARILASPVVNIQRSPFFCSGCPHNTSTKVPEGSRAMAGIGCHGMVMWMPSRNTDTITHMGAEGANWIGQAPFSEDTHIFQNLGDGTYNHSGLLAIRAAIASGVNITYKILYNDAVAMTGGQSTENGFTVAQVAAQVLAEGAKRVVVVSDEPEKYVGAATLPGGIRAEYRDELDRIQRELREMPGTTVLIYDQTCAAEKRRRRKRGQFPDPAKRVVINPLVCEGCGDCSEKSNCVSVKPLETEFGRKRQIDQSNCNKDFSCLNGFCPSFVTVHGGELRKPAPKVVGDVAVPPLPEPERPQLREPFDILVTGIGGTGVVTIGALIGMAAHLEGRGCSSLDFTGLAQKNGAVMSHIRLAQKPEDLAAVRIGPGAANLLLGCDMVVAASPQSLSRLENGVTKAVINTSLQPTASFVMDPDIDFEQAAMVSALNSAIGESGLMSIDATGRALALTGDAIPANVFMLGYAYQKGFMPLHSSALERAIELNGTAVEASKRIFALGRYAAHDPAEFDRRFGTVPEAPDLSVESLAEIIERRCAFLADYQDAAYAERFRARIAEVAAAERAAGCGERLTREVVVSLFKLMAYKDEYEVARLHASTAFGAQIDRQFGGNYRLRFHLAPPLLAKRDPVTGHARKMEFGSWMLPVFRTLARFRRLRGTRLDPFGYLAERRTERELIDEYTELLDDIVRNLNASNHAAAVKLAAAPQRIRGYGHVKDAAIARYRSEVLALVDRFREPASQRRDTARRKEESLVL